MTMLFLLMIPVLAVVGYRLYRANAKVQVILREELPGILRVELPDPPPLPAAPLGPGAFQPERPVTVGTSAARTGSA
ncbi:MAG: hypothetical protein ACJ72N_10730 [Labedaea sp.]